MLFSSLTFLFAFLPCIILAYFLIKNRTYRNCILLFFSLGFYAWGEPIYIILMLFSLISNYITALVMDKYKHNPKMHKAVFIFGILLNLGLLGYFKYSNFFIGNINSVFNLSIEFLKISLPIGISFYTFQILSYFIDVYQGKVKVQKSFLILSTYVALFPQLIAGPIVRYQTVEEDLLSRKENIDDFAQGIRRFIMGLGKKIIISNQAALIADTIFATNMNDLGFSLAWVGIIAYTLQIYFDFSGYSDMAIGLGKMFGFRFLENFNYPYIATSITDFWRRWHISLSSWFKDYVYIPLGGNRVSKKRWLINIFIVWLLTGMWHGATWNFIIWGLYFGVILVLEKLFIGKYLKKSPKVVQHIYALLFICIGWVIFRSVSVDQILLYLKAMFGLNGFNSIKVFYNLSIAHLWPYLVIGIVASTPIFKKMFDKMNSKLISGIVFDLFLFLVFFICVMFLVNNSFNPFIYWQF